MGGVAASRSGRWVSAMLIALCWVLLPAGSSAQTDEADACVRDLGTLDAATTHLSGSGIVAQDSGCTSSQRDPGSASTYYARRHTFTLGVDSSVSFGHSGSRMTALLIEGSSSDGTGTVLGRGSGSHLVLEADTYTIEATTDSPGLVGSYSVWVQRYDLTPCVRDLGTLDAATTHLSGSGIVAQDSGCTSSQRDPGSASTYYARRHTFTLGVDSSVSFGHSGSRMTALLIEGSSSDGTGTVLGRGSGSHLVLEADTYTIEATTDSPGLVGSYSVWVQRYDLTPCVRDLGTLDAATTHLSGSGIVAQDSGCTSSQRDPGSASTYYARRHTFTLGVDSSVSFGHSGSRMTALLIEGSSSDGTGTVLGRGSGSHLVLEADTYTIEATTDSPGLVGSYSVWVQRYDLTPCVRDLGTLDAATTHLSGSGIVAQDSGCTSSQRDPGSASTYYARRHTFTLGVDSSVSFGHSGSRMTALLIEGSSSDGTGTVLGRGSGSHLVLEADTYTIEATTDSPGLVGSYSVWVQRYDLTPCVRDLGTLDAATTHLSGSGIVAQDSGCTSSQRDPGSASTYYARRHTFTLGVPGTVSVSLTGSRPQVLLIEGSSSDGTGAVVARNGSSSSYTSVHLRYLLLPAGTYTVEATTHYAQAVGSYSVSVSRWPADACVRDLGTLDATTSSATGSGIVAVDASCTSSQRDPGSASTYYARRHTFTLGVPGTVSVSLTGSRPQVLLIEGSSSDGTGAVVARNGSSSSYTSVHLRYLLLPAGTYTVEATTHYAQAVGSYSVSVSRWPADACVRDLGTLDATTSSATGSGSWRWTRRARLLSATPARRRRITRAVTRSLWAFPGPCRCRSPARARRCC